MEDFQSLGGSVTNDADSFCVVVDRLTALKPLSGRFVLKCDDFMVNWTPVMSSKMISFLNEKLSYSEDVDDYHEFVLGSFGDQHLVNVSLSHDKQFVMKQASWLFIKNVVPIIQSQTKDERYNYQYFKFVVQNPSNEFSVIVVVQHEVFSRVVV